MNCQNCGAENESGARFCAECGAPLEDSVEVVDQATADDDKTIVSTVSVVDEAAKTVNVSREDLAAAAEAADEDEETASTDEPESGAAPPPSRPLPESDADDGGWKSRSNIIIAVVILVLLLCCCCFFLAVGSLAGSGVLEDIQRELGLSVINLCLV